MLWGQTLTLLETLGVSLMFAGALFGAIALAPLTSSFVLWTVQAAAPRSLSKAEIAAIAQTMSPFAGLRVVLGAVSPSKNNADLTKQILEALTDAKIDAFINHEGLTADVDPAQIRGRLVVRGIPSGVSDFFVTGNERSEAFSVAFAKALNDAGIKLFIIGGMRE
jgi:hypothetical protein